MTKLDMKNPKNVKKFYNMKKRCENCKYYSCEFYLVMNIARCTKHDKYLCPFWDNEPCQHHSLKIPNKLPELHIGDLSIFDTTFGHLKN